MKRALKIIAALAELQVGSGWPASYIGDEVLPRLSQKAKKAIDLASLVVDLSPIIPEFRTFTMLSAQKRKKWLESLNAEGLVYSMVSFLEFLISAVYFADSSRAADIGYRREPLLPLPSGKAPPQPLSASRGPDREYDAVVVGSGAGGAIAAWELSRRGLKVGVFEAGPEPDPAELLTELPAYRAIKYYWDNGLTFTWGSPMINLPFGRVLGGTVTVNSGTLFRMPSEAVSRWYQEAGVKVDPEKLSQAYKIVEEKLNVKAVPEELLGENALVMRRGAEELGLRHYPVKRPLGDCRGFGECAFGCPSFNGKLDMRSTFLREALENGLAIFTRAEVKKVAIKGGRAVGVLVNIAGETFVVNAKVIVLAAGALNTPRLLKASGIKNKNLGQHLHIHPAAGVTAVMGHRVNGWRGTMQSYCVDSLLQDWHTLLLATFPPPGIGYSAGSLPLSRINDYPFLASIGVQASDEGEGSVLGRRIAGVASYEMSDGDLQKVKEGVKLAAEVFFAAGAKEAFLPLKKAGSAQSVSEVEATVGKAKPKAFKLSAYHPMSTARMGGDPDAGVVDGDGRVYGVESLYIADASVLPSSTYVNPQLTINALGLMIAGKIAEDLGA